MSGIVVLISGRGSNLAAMCKAGLAHHIKCVISNKADAPGLNIAKEFGIDCHVIEHKQFASREEFDRQLAHIIDRFEPQYIILAGFMRILSPWFVSHYSRRLINIHPSLLPAFIGFNAIEQAFAAQVKITGATIHFVTEELDHGPIIAQGIVSAVGCHNVEELANRIHNLEHILYPFIIHKLITHKVVVSNNDSIIVEKENIDTKFLNEFSNHVFY
jgi:phosphoribosylglycinamide formyltransferase 1